MPAMRSPSTFHVLTDTRPDDKTLSPFMVTTARGFLPRTDPLTSLPADFAALEDILRRMPVRRLDGQPGLLATGELGGVVAGELPDLSEAVRAHAGDMEVMTALYRDYSFLTSAYLLEPCHGRFVRGEPYGLARQVLPRNIAVPFNTVAQM
jgi:indoleamine 2,3-dioxygenase